MNAPTVFIGRACRHKIDGKTLTINDGFDLPVVKLVFTSSGAAQKFYASVLSMWHHLEDLEGLDDRPAWVPQNDGEPW